jgi:hypothetical protein
MIYQFVVSLHDNQFVHPDPKGSELIFPAPFRAGVIRRKQFAG